MSTCHFVDAIGRIVPAETSVYIYIYTVLYRYCLDPFLDRGNAYKSFVLGTQILDAVRPWDRNLLTTYSTRRTG